VVVWLVLWRGLEGLWLPALLLASFTVELSFRLVEWWLRRRRGER
jgi:hypothetical protein